MRSGCNTSLCCGSASPLSQRLLSLPVINSPPMSLGSLATELQGSHVLGTGGRRPRGRAQRAPPAAGSTPHSCRVHCQLETEGDSRLFTTSHKKPICCALSTYWTPGTVPRPRLSRGPDNTRETPREGAESRVRQDPAAGGSSGPGTQTRAAAASPARALPSRPLHLTLGGEGLLLV